MIKTAENRGVKCVFNDKYHTYTVNGKRLDSATKYLKRYQHPFDPDGSAAARCAARNKITPEEQRAIWDAKRDEAAAVGTNIHAYCEAFLTHTPMPPVYNDRAESLLESANKACKAVQQNYDIVSVEQILFSPHWGIAGTADLICRNNEGFIILDWKTNEVFKNDNIFENLKFPFEEYQASDFNKYSLQLRLYSLIMRYENFFGFKPEDNVKSAVIHIAPDKFEFIVIPDLFDDHLLTGLNRMKGI